MRTRPCSTIGSCGLLLTIPHMCPRQLLTGLAATCFFVVVIGTSKLRTRCKPAAFEPRTSGKVLHLWPAHAMSAQHCQAHTPGPDV